MTRPLLRSATMEKPAKKKLGRPRLAKPADGTTRLQVRIPPDLVAKIEAAAAKDDRSRDSWIRRALEAALRGKIEG